MIPIRARRPNPYSASPLDRASARREDAAFLAAARESPDSLFVPVWRGQSLLAGEAEAVRGVFLAGAEADPWRVDAPWAFLGLWQERPVFAIDCGAADAPPVFAAPAFGETTRFADLRAAAGALPEAEAAILAHARGLLHWRARHRFCGVCGAACEARSGGNTLVCTRCETPHFPRTDPAVIMLVVQGDAALLGHSPRFPVPEMYSTLAGFVEPGESLEEAVAREVFEETGVRVGAVTYHSSQPWPFPASLMLGFYAAAQSTEIVLDPAELSDARWFSRADIRNHKALGFRLPRGDSIARRLIEDWLESG